MDRPVPLSGLPLHRPAIIESVEDRAPGDVIARRLRELGFVHGEPVRVVAAGPLGAEPLLVQIGYTRFALRRAEAARVMVRDGVVEHESDAAEGVTDESAQAVAAEAAERSPA